ncbi:MAG: hypothetical protein ACUVX8_02600 [Candidatus Zipacnadales bacterium]
MMRKFDELIFKIGMGVLTALGASGPAHAYIDPGTGSYLFQLAIAGLLSALFVIRLYWRKLKGLFGRVADEEEGE